MGKNVNSDGLYFGGLHNHCRMKFHYSHEIKRCLLLGRKAMTNIDSILKSRDITLPTKVRTVKAMVFPVVMCWYHSWTINKAKHQSIHWCFWTVVLEKTLESPLDCKEIHPVHPKGDQSCVHWKDWRWSWDSNTLATWCKELTHWKRPWLWARLKAGEGDEEDEMVGWQQQLNGHEFEQAPGDGEGQGSLACCSPWVRKESDMAEWPYINNMLTMGETG